LIESHVKGEQFFETVFYDQILRHGWHVQPGALILAQNLRIWLESFPRYQLINIRREFIFFPRFCQEIFDQIKFGCAQIPDQFFHFAAKVNIAGRAIFQVFPKESLNKLHERVALELPDLLFRDFISQPMVTDPSIQHGSPHIEAYHKHITFLVVKLIQIILNVPELPGIKCFQKTKSFLYFVKVNP
jgi:hypothetical protein